MKYLLIILLVVSVAFAVDYSAFKDKATCDFNNGFWCYRCQNSEGNTFGADTCVSSNSQCNYQCSLACGSKCATDSDCPNILNNTDDTCRYDAQCSSCSCNYKIVDCPQNGTVANNICYYGKRECGTSGCSIKSCALSAGQVCDPNEGCVSCGDCGSAGEFYKDYTCKGNNVYAKKTVYSCNATGCLFTRDETLVEECDTGCSDGKCTAQLCNFNGVRIDCSRFDGFSPEKFCNGKDVYGYYRTYYCGTDACAFDSESRLVQTCPVGCEDGICVNKRIEAAIVDTPNTTTPNPVIAVPNQTQQEVYAGAVYNGWLFGARTLELRTAPGKSGRVYFEIMNSNRIAPLRITTNGQEVFGDRPEPKGLYSVGFTNAGSKITFAADSSTWIFFMPNSYTVTNAYIVYDD